MKLNHTLPLLLWIAFLPGEDQQEKSIETIKLDVLSKSEGSLSTEYVDKAFASDKIETHDIIVEKFAKPYEAKPWEEYKKLFITDKRISGGVEFHKTHRETIHNISKEYGVDEYVLISIIGVETNFGEHKGPFTVFNALYTQIAMMPKRQKWATKELVKFLTLCEQDGLDPHEIHGSYAGAFGFGQFIPSSFLAYAVDENGDGIRDPYHWEDVLGSIANYLKRNGYDSSSGDFQKSTKNWKSIYAYNHSDNYVKAILGLRKEIKTGVEG